ncbi:MAG: 16S rRNA (cytidine(1402)-2'-O)-methyltransferase [Candidatus Magasanikbacteria bacterium]|jgi:16S rRNA (cytidine1402-2'-O)-methyltransferase
MATGKLYIVATPIGNFGDITLRALETLKSVDLVLCEDTRMTRRLLDHYAIEKPTKSYHQHSTARDVKDIVAILEQGSDLALVTDAGTPGISDPGNLLIKALVHSAPAIAIVPIPGPSAVIAALSISGFATDKFVFMGFPPHKNKRQKYFKEVAIQDHTVVFYESGHRIAKCITELSEVLDPHCQIMVGRELTKMFETIYRGNIAEIIAQKIDERGEFVVVISQK